MEGSPPAGDWLSTSAPSLAYEGGLRAPDRFGGWAGETATSEAATAPAPPPQPPIPQPPAGGFLSGLGDWLANNRSALMGLGAGIAGGRTWGEGLSKGFQNAMSGRALDQQHAAHSQTVAALMRHGLDETTARAAAGNPTMLRALLWQFSYPRSRPR
jgi:hypothetical protein